MLQILQTYFQTRRIRSLFLQTFINFTKQTQYKMKMALTAGCLFLLQCFLLTDISVADPLIDVTPSQIILGTTLTLDINCTFSLGKHPNMAALISLVLSRANDSGENFEDLAAITEFSPDSVHVVTQETVSATGVADQKGDSFLFVRWQYPTALQGGVYQCSALGVDMLGRNVDITNTSLVMVNEANLNDVFEKLKDMEMHESSMEQQIQNLQNITQTLKNDKVSMEQTIQTLENDKVSMDQQIQTLVNKTQTQENYIKNLENLIDFVTPVTLLGEYGGKKYYMAKKFFYNINASIDVCRSLNGDLATINDAGEFHAIQGLLQAVDLRPANRVIVAGTDEVTEGEWYLPYSNVPMPYTSWQSDHPSNNYLWNCVALDFRASWFMADTSCRIEPPNALHLFMCEV